MAGFSINEVNKLTFKVQAAGVIDASAGARWYESSLAFSPNIKDTTRILTNYNSIPPANDPAAAVTNAAADPTNISDLSANGSASKLDQVYAFNNSTWILYNTPGDTTSGFKNNWILPASIPQANGQTSGGYAVKLWSGDPSGVAGSFKEIQITAGEGPPPQYVGWVFNYDQGLLFISDYLQGLIDAGGTDYPGTVAGAYNLYLTGFRYIGPTGAGSGDRYADCTTQDITQPVSGTLTLTISTGLSYTTGQSIQITSGANIILGTVSTYTTGTGVIDITVTSSTGASLGSATWCIALSGGSGINTTYEYLAVGSIPTGTVNSPPMGTGYSSAVNVSTTGGSGTGMTVDTTVSGGGVQTVTINNPGTGYAIGDNNIVISGGNGGAVITLAGTVGETNPSLRLIDNNSTFEDVKLTGGTNVTITRTGDTGITFDATGGGSLNVLEDGTVVGDYTKMNFIGDGVLAQDSGITGQVDVYIPPPSFASYYNDTNGTTTGTVIEGGLSRKNLRVSSPSSEGNPYSVNGWDNGTLRSSTKFATQTIQPGQGTGQLIVGFSAPGTALPDAATLTVEVFDADGTALLATFTTPAMDGDNTFNSTGVNAGITVGITNHAQNATKWQANISTSVNTGTIFGNQSPARDGGRYNIKTTFKTDVDTDNTGPYTYTQPGVFYDTGSTTLPTVTSMTMTESTILSKHISGVEYYKLGSQFDVLVDDIDILNPNTQGFNNGSVYNLNIVAPEYGVTGYNIPMWDPNSVVGISGATTPGWNNVYNTNNIDFNWNSWPITANNYRYRGAAANGTSAVYHPWSATGTSVNSGVKSILIDTVNDNAGQRTESFNGESERLFRNGTAYAAWNSTTALVNSAPNYNYQSIAPTVSEACCVGSYLVRADKYFLTDPNTSTLNPDLALYKPNSLGANPNYSTLTNPAVFSRRWYTTSNPTKPITKLTMTFAGDAGVSGNFLAALLARNILIYVRRTGSTNGGAVGYGANPTILHAAPGNPNSGEYSSNAYDDAAGGTDLLGAQMMQTTGVNNIVDGVFGSSGSPGDCIGGFWTDIIIVDPTIEIEAISCVITFNDGSSE